MTTVNKVVKDTIWEKLTSSSKFMIQNVSSKPAKISINTVSPTKDEYFLLNPYCMIDTSVISGTAWGKAVGGSVTLSVTEDIII